MGRMFISTPLSLSTHSHLQQPPLSLSLSFSTDSQSTLFSLSPKSVTQTLKSLHRLPSLRVIVASAGGGAVCRRRRGVAASSSPPLGHRRRFASPRRRACAAAAADRRCSSSALETIAGRVGPLAAMVAALLRRRASATIAASSWALRLSRLLSSQLSSPLLRRRLETIAHGRALSPLVKPRHRVAAVRRCVGNHRCRLAFAPLAISPSMPCRALFVVICVRNHRRLPSPSAAAVHRSSSLFIAARNDLRSQPLYLPLLNELQCVMADSNVGLVDAKLQRRRQELTQTTPNQPVDDEAVYYKVAGVVPKDVCAEDQLQWLIMELEICTSFEAGYGIGGDAS
ncbi:hypothetical protein Scep_004121 [Stephania cephalantha]|uniref:Uncharacterized protein n=1 Tax=Stephania cephalantha TaxID=152367 RepID=A0AAP0KTN6_9MAGN